MFNLEQFYKEFIIIIDVVAIFFFFLIQIGRGDGRSNIGGLWVIIWIGIGLGKNYYRKKFGNFSGQERQNKRMIESWKRKEKEEKKNRENFTRPLFFEEESMYFEVCTFHFSPAPSSRKCHKLFESPLRVCPFSPHRASKNSSLFCRSIKILLSF